MNSNGTTVNQTVQYVNFDSNNGLFEFDVGYYQYSFFDNSNGNWAYITSYDKSGLTLYP